MAVSLLNIDHEKIINLEQVTHVEYKFGGTLQTIPTGISTSGGNQSSIKIFVTGGAHVSAAGAQADALWKYFSSVTIKEIDSTE